MALLYNIIDNKGVFKSDYLSENILNLLDTTFIIPDSYNYNVFEVTEEYIARPDLISYDAYGDTMYTDIICKINGISNPFELNKDMLLIIPSIDSIDKFSVNPSLKEKEMYSVGSSDYNKSNQDQPIAKQKNQKRKANEAVIGDRRFNVDPATGIVIY